jgi:hypothetical protein
VLARSVMDLPIISEDNRLLELLRAHGDELLAKRRTATGMRSMVENRLIGGLPSGNIQAAVIAKQLGTSERSLRRQLAQEAHQASARSLIGYETGWPFAISKTNMSRSSRSHGCWGIRKSRRLTTPSDGGQEPRQGKQDSGPSRHSCALSKRPSLGRKRKPAQSCCRSSLLHIPAPNGFSVAQPSFFLSAIAEATVFAWRRGLSLLQMAESESERSGPAIGWLSYPPQVRCW